MSKFEKKFGRYAIHNLTLILIACYVVGYIIQAVNSDFLFFLTLDAERILHGQVWRLFTWLIVPPSSFDIFTIIMLYFYYSIGTLMERTLGTYRYNVYILGGILLTIVASFLAIGGLSLFPGLMGEEFSQSYQTILELSGRAEARSYLNGYISVLALTYSRMFSTYYINLSIFLAFAVCYPEMQVLLMFLIPVKVKWMGILDLVLLGYSLITGDYFTKFAIGAALINFLLFFLSVKNLSHLKPSQIKRRAEYKQKMQAAGAITRHKCAVCGQTEQTSPDLEFRFCSKCNGNYEYCSHHLYTHEHVK